MEDKEDSFASNINRCIITDSQEEKLRRSRFAGDSPENSDSVSSSPPPEQPAITMVSGSVSQPCPSGSGSGSEYPKQSSKIAALGSQIDGDEEGLTKQKVAESNGGLGKRKLPWSMRGCENTSNGSVKNGSFKDLMESVEIVLGMDSNGSHGGENCSLMEFAQSHGWEFPPPGWWPPEGFPD